MDLTGRRKRSLRARAHDLSPVVQIGREGLHHTLADAVDRALFDHELIKVKLPQVDRDERRAMAARIADHAEAGLVGLSGRVLILYRPRPDDAE
jgi:RNA-binding protein